MPKGSFNLKKTKLAVLDQLCEKILAAKKTNNDKVPYGYLAKIVSESCSLFPWLNRDLLNNHMLCRGKEKKECLRTPPKNLWLFYFL